MINSRTRTAAVLSGVGALVFASLVGCSSEPSTFDARLRVVDNTGSVNGDGCRGEVADTDRAVIVDSSGEQVGSTDLTLSMKSGRHCEFTFLTPVEVGEGGPYEVSFGLSGVSETFSRSELENGTELSIGEPRMMLGDKPIRRPDLGR